MKRQKQKRKDYYIAILTLLILTLGYAVYTQEISINGTVEGTTDFNVYFMDAWVQDIAKGTATINTGNKSDTVTFNVNLAYPGDKCIVGTKIKNASSIPVKLNNFTTNIDNSNSDIKYDYIAINTNDEVLNSNEICDYEFVIYWDENSTNTDPETVSIEFQLNYEQNTKKVKLFSHHENAEISHIDLNDIIPTEEIDEETFTYEGDGTEENPYLINNANEFLYFAQKVNEGESYQGKHFLLTTSIDLSYLDWVPIGGLIDTTSVEDVTSKPMFDGSFDGGNHTVYNIVAEYDNKGAVGLFGALGENGVISNLNVGTGEIKGRLLVGGLVGVNYGTIINCSNSLKVTAESYNGENENGNYSGGITGWNETTGKIIGCSNSGNITSTNGNSNWNGGWAAGIAGYSKGDISDSKNSGNIYAKHYRAGGIVGTFSLGTIENCENTGDVSCGWRGAGGIVAYCSNGGEIYNCKNYGKIYAPLDDVGGIAGDVNGDSNNNGSRSILKDCENNGLIQTDRRGTAGVAGWLEGANDVIENCVNNADVYATNDGTVYQYRFAGIVADGNGKILNCTNNGNITVYGQVAGGIAGSFNGEIKDCTNTGTITLYYDKNNSTNSGIYTGGIVGLLKNDGDLENVLENCTNSGEINGITYTGGIAGALFKTEITNCNNSGTITAENDYTGGIVGYYGDSEMSSCTNTGNVNGKTKGTGGIAGITVNSKINDVINLGEVNSTGSYTAGISGYANTNAVFDNCINEAKIYSTSTYTGGIVGCLYSTSIIKNCTNKEKIESKANYVGGIVAYVSKDDTQTVKVLNCINTNEVKSTGQAVGGIAGYSYEIVENSNNSGEIITTSNYVGGIVGYSQNNIINCENTGNVQGITGIAGITGDLKNKGDVNNCINRGTISGTGYCSAGIVGINNANTTITNCENYGNVSADLSMSAGISGISYGGITNCVNYANITSISSGKNTYKSVTYPNSVGGVVAALYSGNVTNVYNSGTVSINNNSDILDCAGGIIGIIGSTEEQTQSVTNAYNKGIVQSEDYFGNIAGQQLFENKVSNTYYLNTLSGYGLGYIGSDIENKNETISSDEIGITEKIPNNMTYEEFIEWIQ